MPQCLIDAWVNLRVAGHAWQKEAGSQYFKRPPDEIRDHTAAELLAIMDEAGVQRAIVGVNGELPEKDVVRMAAAHPDRIALAPQIDPRRGMKAVRALEDIAKNEHVLAVRLLPCLIDRAPDDRVYYPLYAKAIELELPVCITTGMPAPRLPGRCQDPVHLDDVCLFFPELTVVMSHGADPWWAMAIRLMLKFPKLHLMTSACAPRYLPAELLAFMNSRGGDKVLFASDFPFLDLARCVAEANALGLREEVRDQYLYKNAGRVFFGEVPEVAP